MQPVVKGMIQVADATDRIVRVTHGQNDVIQVRDDARLGTFSNSVCNQAASKGIDDQLLRQIVGTAIQAAKTSWVGRLALG